MDYGFHFVPRLQSIIPCVLSPYFASAKACCKYAAQVLIFLLSISRGSSNRPLVILSEKGYKTDKQLTGTIRILAEKEIYMTKFGLDRMEVRAVFRRTLSLHGRIKEEDIDFIDHLANAVGEVVEENNKKLWGQFEDYLKRRQ